MNETVFVILSTLYLISLAIIDGLFNRLVFRQSRKLSYFSPIKQKIYHNWEWRAVGVILLIVLPVVLPSAAAFLLGGNYLKLYWIVLLLVQWDMIFGALVFDDWFGDQPSIALPVIGWMNFPLLPVVISRAILALLLILTFIK